jgi:hypothetical protein
MIFALKLSDWFRKRLLFQSFVSFLFRFLLPCSSFCCPKVKSLPTTR